MLRRLLSVLAEVLPEPRVIYDRAGVSPYLSRWYLVGRPKTPQGEAAAFDATGNRVDLPQRDAPFGLYLHKFHRGDDDEELHNHPWAWSVSLILFGGYLEERRDGFGRVRKRMLRPGSINRIFANDFHRVTLRKSECWTLFLAGPRTQSWGFWNRRTGAFQGWQEFLREKRHGNCECGHKDDRHQDIYLVRLDRPGTSYRCRDCGCQNYRARDLPEGAQVVS